MSDAPQKNTKAPKHWREKRGGIVRSPRPWNAEVDAFLHDFWPTEVFLREDEKTTEVVVRFPKSSKGLSEGVRSKYDNLGMSLSAAFDEMVWTPRETGEESCWAPLARAAEDAYWSAWMHLLTVAYGDASFPEVNEQTRKWLEELKATRRSHSGRRPELDAERNSYERRFEELLRWCESLHGLVKQCNEEGATNDAIEQKVFEKFNRQRHVDDILNGTAFDDWPVNRTVPVLHNALTWTPRKLSFALLALERKCEYQTVARKIGADPGGSVSKS